MCVLLCYPVSVHMSQLLSTGHPISSFFYVFLQNVQVGVVKILLVLKQLWKVNYMDTNISMFQI